HVFADSPASAAEDTAPKLKLANAPDCSFLYVVRKPCGRLKRPDVNFRSSTKTNQHSVKRRLQACRHHSQVQGEHGAGMVTGKEPYAAAGIETNRQFAQVNSPT